MKLSEAECLALLALWDLTGRWKKRWMLALATGEWPPHLDRKHVRVLKKLGDEIGLPAIRRMRRCDLTAHDGEPRKKERW